MRDEFDKNDEKPFYELPEGSKERDISFAKLIKKYDEEREEIRKTLQAERNRLIENFKKAITPYAKKEAENAINKFIARVQCEADQIRACIRDCEKKLKTKKDKNK